MNHYRWRGIVGGLLLLLIGAPAAQGAGSGKSFAEEFLTETNLARTEPHRYAEFLSEFRRRFVGSSFALGDSVTMVQTKEGPAAVDEAVRFLAGQKDLPPLKWSAGLAKAAADLVRDQERTGSVGHTGSRSGGMKERIEKHGRWESRIGENLAYGPRSARLIVIQLIVDDGVARRGHRKNIFNGAFAVAGAACGSHPVYEFMCAMDFAGGFLEGESGDSSP